MTNEKGGAGFMTQGPDSAYCSWGVRFVKISMPRIELRMGWEGITYARIILGIDRLIMERDSLAIVAWLQGCLHHDSATHSLVCDIRSLLLGCASTHIHHEMNSAMDWIASFVARHSGKDIWNDTSPLPMSFHKIFMIFWDVFMFVLYDLSSYQKKR